MNQSPFSSTLFKPHIPPPTHQDTTILNPRSRINSNVNRSLPASSTQMQIVPPPQPKPPIRNLNRPSTNNPAPIEKKELRVFLSPIIQNGPISPQEAIEKYSPLLTRYEMNEIKNFQSIYYLGIVHRKINPDQSNQFNGGFDTNDHAYKIINGDHLAYRYEILFSIGEGAFGQVIKALDHKTGEQVAIKIIVNTKQMHTEGKLESDLLTKLNSRSCPNVVQAYDVFLFRNHLCISFEILGRDLFELIQGKHYSRLLKPFPDSLIKSYALQIFQGLAGIHDAGIVHCDIKPENILVTKNSRNIIKIIDFGSGCFEGFQTYQYVQSRFFRAPEVVLGIKYGPPIDIWSTAMVIIELMTGRPLFECENELELLWMITELLGPPPDHLIQKSTRKKTFFDEQIGGKFVLKRIPRKYFRPSSLDLMKFLDTKDFQLYDLLIRCITWNSETRITAKEALNHPWIQTKSVIPAKQQPRLTTSIVTQSPSLLPSLQKFKKVE